MASQDKPTFSAWLEWEYLKGEYVISNPNIEAPLPGTPLEIKIWRDDDYKLEAKIYGKIKPETPHATEQKDTLGEIVPSFSISGEQGADQYELGGCILGGSVEEYHPDADPTDGKFSTILHFQRIKIIQQKEANVEWLTEWYINGIKSSIIFPRSTSREYKNIYSRKREVLKKGKETFDARCHGSSSSDYAFIDCGDFGFIIQKVPDQLGPSWSENIGIEYRREFGGIPPPETRLTISEIVSFILGKHLLNVGFSSYDSKGEYIEVVSVNPWGDNVRHLSQSAGIPPIQINSRGIIESILPPIINQYLQLRNPMKLDEVLWRYWIGSELPLGSNIPIMANGIEILSKYWYKSKKSKLKGIYLAKDKFDSITQEEFEKIEINLEKSIFKEKIMNKLKSCYSMTLTDRLKFFFSEIDLKIGDMEQEAINCRHKMIHSNVLTGDREIEKIIRLSYAYRCLFHRTLLKILGYSGKYIDYSMSGLPEKPIDDFVGTNEPN